MHLLNDFDYTRCKKQCAVRKALFFNGCESRPATFAPAGSNQGSRGGNEAAEASDVEGP
jgi:hypothetical protein